MKYFRASVISVIAHVAVFIIAISYAAISGCRFKKQKVELVEFTIAVDQFIEEEPPAPKEEVKKSPPEPPPKKDDIAIKKEPKKPEPKKPEPKKPEPKKAKPKIEKGKRVTKPVVKSDIKPKTKQTLSDAEIQKWLNKRVKIGETTSLPQNDLSLNFSILKNAIDTAWYQPPREAAGFRPAEITFNIGPGGRISNPRIAISSGSVVFDKSAIDAINRIGSLPDLSAEFIKQYKELTIEFKLKD